MPAGEPPSGEVLLECAAPLAGAVTAEGSNASLQAEIEQLRRTLAEALEQQTATSEILRVISSSPTDLQPVLHAVAHSAAKIEAGRMELELTDFHLPTALDNALTLVRERAGRRGIALHMTTDERLDYVRAERAEGPAGRPEPVIQRDQVLA